MRLFYHIDKPQLAGSNMPKTSTVLLERLLEWDCFVNADKL